MKNNGKEWMELERVDKKRELTKDEIEEKCPEQEAQTDGKEADNEP